MKKFLFLLISVILCGLRGKCSDFNLKSEENIKAKISMTLKTHEEQKNISTSTREQKSLYETDSLPPTISETFGNDQPNISSEALKSMFNFENDALESAKEKLLTSEATVGEDSKDGHFGNMTELLPEAQELRFERPGIRIRPLRRYSLRKPPIFNRRNIPPEVILPPVINIPKRIAELRGPPNNRDCIFFTKTVCLEAFDYPLEAIMRSIRSNEEMISSLLIDYRMDEVETRARGIPQRYSFKDHNDNRDKNYGIHSENNELKRKSDYSVNNIEEGFTCPSHIQYARPQLARAASGTWKYIINTGEHTQTLRLEKCSTPRSSCSFISSNYRSSCVQVYNYHRLLTWDTKLGLHMDIFKVPTCCSCHVLGYEDLYPPHQKDPPSKLKESFPGADFAVTDPKIDFDNIKNSDHDSINQHDDHHVSHFDLNYDLYHDHASTLPGTFEDSIPATKTKSSTFYSSSNRSTRPLSSIRLKKPTISTRPFEKLPQQHAPNTRAPGYTGTFIRNTRLSRPARPNRRESIPEREDLEVIKQKTFINRFSWPDEQHKNLNSKDIKGHYGEDTYDNHTKINYNYHPIIDFFKPQASMLKADNKSEKNSGSPAETDSDSWKPIIS